MEKLNKLRIEKKLLVGLYLVEWLLGGKHEMNSFPSLKEEENKKIYDEIVYLVSGVSQNITIW